MRMKYSRRVSLLLASICVSMSCVGCFLPPRDISHEPAIRELGLIGRCLVVKTDAPLWEVGKPYRRLAFQEPSQPETGGPGRHIGTVTAGTRLHVVRVGRAAWYDDGLFARYSDLAFGRIDTGEFAGKVVDLWGWPEFLPRADQSPDPYEDCPH